MKQLTCEMCGSTDLLKQEGVFVCQTCGCKYSLEEARKMMNVSAVEVQGTVRVDSSDKIKNYLEMANSAYEAGNKTEAEAYCNKIIEIDPKNPHAWFTKGKAAGWQSTLSNIRIEESVQCFSKAISYSSDEEAEKLKADSAKEISDLCLALISVSCDNFAEHPSADNAASITSNAANSITYTIQLLSKCGVKPDEYVGSAAALMNNAAMTAYNTKIQPEYKENKYPSKYDFSTYLNDTCSCEAVIRAAITLADKDYKGNIQRYKNLISLSEALIEGGGWERSYSQYDALVARELKKKGIECVLTGGGYYYAKITSLKDSAKSSRRDDINKYRNEISQCERLAAEKAKADRERAEKEQKERNEKYWTEHADEKKQLEDELNTLQSEKTQLDKKIADVENNEIAPIKSQRSDKIPSESRKEALNKEISELNDRISKLGVFKGKEKKTLREARSELEAKLTEINEVIEKERAELTKKCNDRIAEIENRIEPHRTRLAEINKRVAEINQELTKNR